MSACEADTASLDTFVCCSADKKTAARKSCARLFFYQDFGLFAGLVFIALLVGGSIDETVSGNFAAAQGH